MADALDVFTMYDGTDGAGEVLAKAALSALHEAHYKIISLVELEKLTNDAVAKGYISPATRRDINAFVLRSGAV